MRKIIHVDMDCFYAAVEEKYNPSLKGKPLGIGGPPNTRSVLCTANYEARKFGVRAAIPSSQALRLCPSLVLIPPHFELYRKESQAVRQILERFSSQIEPLSLDEAYLDVTHSEYFQGSATLLAKEIKRVVKLETGLTISAGVAPNKFLAKIASDWRKPDGLFTIAPHQIGDFMKPLPVEKIYGVGKVTAQMLHARGIKICLDLQNCPESELQKYFGSRAAELIRYAFGIDQRPVSHCSERKSVNIEETFSIDRKTLHEAKRELPNLFEGWVQRMIKGSYFSRVKSLQVKLKFADFEQTTIEQSYHGIETPQLEHFQTLLEVAWERRAQPIRLLGLGCKLKSAVQTGTGERAERTESKISEGSSQLEFLEQKFETAS